MDAKLFTFLVSACVIGIAASLDSDDILSNVLAGVDTNNANGRSVQGGNTGGLLVNLNPSAGGAYGGAYGDNLVDDYGYDYDENDRHMSSVADLVNVVFGLGGHIVGRAGWIVRDALGALMTGASMVRRLLTPGLWNKLVALRLGRMLMSNSKIVQGMKKPIVEGKLFNGQLLKSLLNMRDGMLYSNYRLSDDDFGLMTRSLGGLRGYGGMYGTSKYPSSYHRFATRRDDD